jgi:alpha-mannosidase
LEFPSIGKLALPELSLLDDPSDTWSHGIECYDRSNLEKAVWQTSSTVENGPLRASLVQMGKIGRSDVQAEWRVYADKPWIECLLRVTWIEKHRILKLDWTLPMDVVQRDDGIMGGGLIRPTDGREFPFRDWTRSRMERDGASCEVALVAPEVYALDCGLRRTSLTLLRSSVMACHAPGSSASPRNVFSDRGEHTFRFRFLAGGSLPERDLERIALNWQRPLLSADVTRGMKNRALHGNYQPARDSSAGH